MGLISEFKQFAAKGNVVDLAVGVIIGSAFGRIVTSLVEDIIMPPIGILIGNVNFEDIKITLREAYQNDLGEIIPAVSVNVGNFIQITFNFLIIAFAIFLMVKFLNKLKRTQEAKEKKEEQKKISEEVQILTEIRDELKKSSKK